MSDWNPMPKMHKKWSKQTLFLVENLNFSYVALDFCWLSFHFFFPPCLFWRFLEKDKSRFFVTDRSTPPLFYLLTLFNEASLSFPWRKTDSRNFIQSQAKNFFTKMWVGSNWFIKSEAKPPYHICNFFTQIYGLLAGEGFIWVRRQNYSNL